MIAKSFFLAQVAVTPSSGNSASLGTVAANLTSASDLFASVLSTIFYAIGIALVAASIMRYRDHRQNPSQTPLSQVIVRLLAGLVIGFFPLIINFLGESTASLSV